MRSRLALNVAVLFIATAGLTKDGLIVSAGVNPHVKEEARKIYVAACASVERELGTARPLRPRILLVLGAEKDTLDWEKGEIRLRAWDPYLFAEGVIALACRQVMPLHVSLAATGALSSVRS